MTYERKAAAWSPADAKTSERANERVRRGEEKKVKTLACCCKVPLASPFLSPILPKMFVASFFSGPFVLNAAAAAILATYLLAFPLLDCRPAAAGAADSSHPLRTYTN